MDGASQSPEGSLAVARQSFYAVYVLFKTEEEAAAWEAGLPPQPADATAGWEVLSSTALRDDRGGYFEGVFRKVSGLDADTIATIVRAAPERCFEPRKDGFVWPDMAGLAKGKPEKFAKGYVTQAEGEELTGGVGILGVGGGGEI
ncbi:MAG TPA: hypothetical protein VD995_22275 [Azospirillum sp.]|nr:hypothetical protein [Azospirillum sp.]